MYLHRNEVDFTAMSEDDREQFKNVAADLGKRYEAALAEQFKRQGVTAK